MRKWLKRLTLFVSATACSVALAAGAALFNAQAHISFTAEAENILQTANIFSLTEGNPTLTPEYQGAGAGSHDGVYIAPKNGASYAGKINGIFGVNKEDTVFEFSFLGSFDSENAKSNRGHFVFHIIDPETEETVFDIGIWDTFYGAQTYVRYGENRWATTTENVTNVDSLYGEGSGYSLFGMDDTRASVLRLSWVGNSNFSVFATALETGRETLIAQFDGTIEWRNLDGADDYKEFGLPMLNERLQNGYKIAFSAEDWNSYNPNTFAYTPEAPNAVPVTSILFESMNGVSLGGATLQTPSWYSSVQAPQPSPVEIQVNGEYEPSYFASEGVVVLGAIFTQAENEGEISDIFYKIGEEEYAPVSVGEIFHEVGEYTVKYVYKNAEVVCAFAILPDVPLDFSRLVSIENGTASVTANATQTGLFVASADGKPYEGRINGEFSGDTKIEYSFPGERIGEFAADESNSGHFIFKVQSLSMPQESFSIHVLDTYGNGVWGTQVCVEYKNRYFSTANTNQTWDGKNTAAGGYGWFGDDGEEPSYFDLRWEYGKLGVYAWNHVAEREILIALFDGCDEAYGMDGSVINDREKKFALPDLSQAFQNGYTISFASQDISFIHTTTNLVEEILVPVTPVRLVRVGGFLLNGSEGATPAWYVENTSTPAVEEVKAEILSVKLLLTENLELFIKTKIDDKYSNPKMTFTYRFYTTEPTSVTTVEPCERSGDEYVFRFDGYTPQYMANALQFTLSATAEGGGEVELAKGRYSLNKYVDDILAGDFDAETKAVVNALQNYGIEVKKASVDSGEFATFENAQMPENVFVSESENKFSLPDGNENAVASFLSAELIYGNNAGLRFKLALQGVEKESALLKVSVAGRTYAFDGAELAEGEELGNYTLDFFSIGANEFDEEISVTVYDEESGALLSAGALTYSINSYFAEIQEDKGKDGYALAKAIYLYGKAVSAYEEKRG